MLRVLFIYLCVLGAIVFVESRPWCGNNRCNRGYDGGGGNYNNEEQYSSQSGYQVDSYYRGGGQNEYSSGGGGNGNGGYSNGGYSSGGYSNDGYSNGGYSNGGYSRDRDHGSGRYDDSAFVPQDCPGCKINSFGNGFGNTNTFNIPK